CASNDTVLSCSWATGAISSPTATVSPYATLFRSPSYTVKVTVLVPRLLQLKLSGFTLIEDIPQLSLLPLFTSSAVMVTCPMASKYTVMSCAWATGAISSTTVTVACAVEKFPEPSYTVKVTVFGPASAQVNKVLSSCLFTILQLSYEPSSISSGVMVASPLPSNSMVIFLVMTTGGISSSTVTITTT